MSTPRRTFLTAALTAARSAAALLIAGRSAKAFMAEDPLSIWANLLHDQPAAARIGRILAGEMPVWQRRNLLARQRSRFGLAAIPSLDLLRDMIAEDYRLDHTITARRVVFSQAEAALFLSSCALKADGACQNDG
jgi:hypothetical protein